MENFVGIDLGTTNSAICTYDGSQTHIWKSPELTDVTPSALYIDRRGNKFFGQRAYNAAPDRPDNCATLFKRFMGTTTSIELSAINRTLSPEECSAEILKVLFGYLPEEIRNSADTGTVITVPAAFNQMKKNATMDAAEMAGIGKVALMQEPVAAVMSVMRVRDTDGIFLIYDLGGGTFDTAIAESIGGRVNLLAHDGIPICGGRDFDRLLVDNLVRPWLHENFELPEDLSVNPEFKRLLRLTTWATERAKIELSAGNETTISLSEDDTRTRDLNGDEIYLEIPLQRNTFDALITERVNDTIDAARETLSKAGLTPNDLECIVWVGGPTNYKPLRDRVAFELGIKGDLAVNPMTAVAEGASLFAESIDWSFQDNRRKDSRGKISSGDELGLAFNYIARTPSTTSKIAVQVEGQVASGSEFQIENLDTGWTSGRLPLKHGTTVDVTLTKSGENTFKVVVYDAMGGPITIEQDKIVITKTTATVDAIPASHSIGIEVLNKLGGRPTLEYLIMEGDPLPKEGRINFKAGESLEAGSSHSLNFKLWAGEIAEPISDNRPIGFLKIKGTDFDDGTIAVNADLECTYKFLDSGVLKLEVSVPSIGGLFDDVYCYVDMALDIHRVAEDGIRTLNRVNYISDVVEDPNLIKAKEKLEAAIGLDSEESEQEKVLEANEGILAAKKLLYEVKKENLKEIRQVDLDDVVKYFDMYIRQHAKQTEAAAFDALVETAQRSIDNNEQDFEEHLGELRGRNFEILWRQDWFVIEQFKQMANSPHLFADKDRFEELVHIGTQLMKRPEIQQIIRNERVPNFKSEVVEQLRAVVAQIMSIPRIGGAPDHDEMRDLITNILVG